MEYFKTRTQGKRRGAVLFSVLLFLLLMLATVFTAISIHRDLHPSDKLRRGNTPTYGITLCSPDPLLYTVTISDGWVVIRNGEGNLFETLDVCAFTLPEADQAALEKGITLYSEEALLSILEDYTG